MKQQFNTWVKISLILVYLVVIAGAFVRMTGSGMGCPDWPKCFGYYIPPTEESALIWAPEREFKQGHVIIKEEQLWVAQKDFTTGKEFNPDYWAPYTKHYYAEFNPYHTWLEYINRLLGALAGLSTVLMALFSLSMWRTKKGHTLLAWGVVFGMGFQAWLGATVVYSVLAPFKITLHMLMALVIIGALMALWPKKHISRQINSSLLKFSCVALALLAIQVILGTQVRAYVDHQSEITQGLHPEIWLQNPPILFYIHRSFSIALLLVQWWIWRISPAELRKRHLITLGLLAVAAISGIVLFYLNFPMGSQTIHLVLATLIFGLQWKTILDLITSKNTEQ
ncbi:MAG: COX15/CtaA family protein [Flavobacteriaceae bacterium]